MERNSNIICPAAYNLLSNPDALFDVLGCADEDEFYEWYELTRADILNLHAKFKYWKKEIPNSPYSGDCYVIPADIVSEMGIADGLLNDLCDLECESGLDYQVLYFSTEDWQII